MPAERIFPCRMQTIPRRVFLTLTAGALVTPRSSGAAHVPALLDHLLLGCSDLDRGVAFIKRHTGIQAMFGGVHPGRGTRNALVSLVGPSVEEPHPRRYLEIIAPDPAQSGAPDRLGLQKLTEPRLVGWAAHPGDLDDFAKRLGTAHLAFDGPSPGSRKRPDGRLLQWKTLNLHDDFGGLLPFFIEWTADTMHPSIDAPSGCQLARFELVTPDPAKLGKIAAELRLAVDIAKEPSPQLRAVIACDGTELQLTS